MSDTNTNVCKTTCPLCYQEADKILGHMFEMVVCTCVVSEGGWILYRMTDKPKPSKNFKD